MDVDYETWVAVKSPSDLSGMSLEVYKHWDARRGTKFSPTWNEFEFETLPTAIIPWCVVMDVDDAETRLTYRFWGTGRVGVHGQEMTGKAVRDFKPPEVAATILKECEHVIDSNNPQLFRKHYLSSKGLKVTIDTVRLPIADDGKNVTKIFSFALGDNLTSSIYSFFGGTPPPHVPNPG